MFDLKLLKRIDWFTIVLVLTLVSFGLVSIASIMSEPFDGTEAGFSDFYSRLNLLYVEKQIVNFMVGVAAFLVFIVIDYQVYKPLIKYAYIACLGILGVLLLVAGSTRGIQGWLVVEQLDRAIQPAELAKICIIIALAKVVSEDVDKQGKLRSFPVILKAVLLCAVPTVLVMLQPDFGTAFVYICILVFIFFAARISWGYILAAIGVVAAVAPLAYFFVLSPEQKKRIDVFIDPSSDTQDAGYNVSQSKIAIGSGQMFGKGYFSSGTLAQLRFVPERHTDFIFAGIVEGLGFVGGTCVICLYFILVFRWIWIASHAKDSFGSLIVIGVTGMLVAHAFENIGMTIGLMPVTGIPLPFISYGGSNLLTNMMGVGLVENVWMRRPQKR
ncbi:MAG: rod shape-determining protein RodA [Eubacteriales bacterium]|nr:rod shape-determining protein RodA [Eubacteriales bacterium]